MSDPVRVLVTGVAGGSIGEQVCKALRLGRRSYHIFAANPEPALALAGGADAVRVLPRASEPGYVDAVISLVEAEGIAFVVPGTEAELLVLVGESARARLDAVGAVLLANGERVVRDSLDKARTFEVLAGAGARLPHTHEIAPGEDPSASALPGTCPWVVKPARGGGGSAGTFIAQDLEELRFFVGFLRRCGYDPLVQEYVGRADEEYTVGVLSTPDGAAAGSVALRREILSTLSNRVRVPNRTGREELGPVLAISSGYTQGRVDDYPGVRRGAEAVAVALGSAGPLNVQGRWHAGELVVFEVNPRFSGTTPMRALAGFNEPELLIDWHLGGGVPAAPAHVAAGSFSRGLVEYFTAVGHTVPARAA